MYVCMYAHMPLVHPTLCVCLLCMYTHLLSIPHFVSVSCACVHVRTYVCVCRLTHMPRPPRTECCMKPWRALWRHRRPAVLKSGPQSKRLGHAHTHSHHTHTLTPHTLTPHTHTHHTHTTPRTHTHTRVHNTVHAHKQPHSPSSYCICTYIHM